MAIERLQKIIARAGIGSRREAEEMITAGRVTVNGKIVDELGAKADAKADHIKVDGRLVGHDEKKRYILLYKPRGVMTTVSDPQGRVTVLDLMRGVKERIYPVGRLDYHSEGLIILTNDGDLAFRVTHPGEGSVKTYHVKVRGVPEQRVVEKLERGVSIDGRRTMPCEIERLRTTGRGESGNAWFEVRLREGRTQQIRRMFAYSGHPVAKLRRVAIGSLSDPNLKPGHWRDLSEREVKLLGAGSKGGTPKRRAQSSKTKAASKARRTSSRTAAGGKARVASGKRGTKKEGATKRRKGASTRSRSAR